MTKPHMKLLNGDVLYEGDYGVTQDDRKVGPIRFSKRYGLVGWGSSGAIVYRETGQARSDRKPSPDDIIAKWVDQDTPKPDYNDGKWHGWNGGECPVHPESLIIALFDDGSGYGKEEAADVYDWGHLPPVAFRVTKPYVEPRKPREWWIAGGCEAWDTEQEAIDNKPSNGDIVHVREVMEDE